MFPGVWSTVALMSGSAPSPSADQDVDFARDIRPILEANCNQCHGAGQSMNGLRLDTRESALKGGQSGPAILPGDGSSSLLYRKIVGDAPGSPMPMTGTLPPDQVEMIRVWLDQGAPWTEAIDGTAAGAKKHWAYVKPVRPSLPRVNDVAWVRNSIDRFVLERLEQEGLEPSPEASRETLIRRLVVTSAAFRQDSRMGDSLRQWDPNNELYARGPRFRMKAKNIIFLFMSGGPSQIDMFESKPRLTALDGQNVPEGTLDGKRFANLRGTPQVLASPYSYDRYGESGAEISELLPHLTEAVDDITIVKSVHAEQFNHAPAQLFINTGHHLIGRPSMGSWLTYGLGSENRDLPGFVVLQSGPVQVFAGDSCWGPAFLPTVYQGVQFRSQGDPVAIPVRPKLDDPQGAPPLPRRPDEAQSAATRSGHRRPGRSRTTRTDPFKQTSGGFLAAGQEATFLSPIGIGGILAAGLQ